MADEKGSWSERWQMRQEMVAHGIQVGWRLPTREDFEHFNDARNLKDSMDTWLPNEVERISLPQMVQSIDYVTPDEQARIHDLTMKEDRTQPERLELIALWSKVAPVVEVVREEVQAFNQGYHLWNPVNLTDTQVQALEDHARYQEDEGQVFGSKFEEDRWRAGREEMPPVAFIKSLVNDAINMGELTEAQRTAVESRMAADYLRDAPDAYRGALTLLATQDAQTLDLFQPRQLAFDDQDVTPFRQVVDRMAEQTRTVAGRTEQIAALTELLHQHHPHSAEWLDIQADISDLHFGVEQREQGEKTQPLTQVDVYYLNGREDYLLGRTHNLAQVFFNREKQQIDQWYAQTMDRLEAVQHQPCPQEQTPQKPHTWIAAEAARLRVEQRSADVVKDVAKKDYSIGF